MRESEFKYIDYQFMAGTNIFIALQLSIIVGRHQNNQVTEAFSIRALQEAVKEISLLGNDSHSCILLVRRNSK